MSAIKLSTPSSGSISLSPADTASNLTITVPANSGTMLTNKTAGTVLQVVSATYGTETTSSSSTYSDSGLSASITPSSTTSKILVMFTHNGSGKSNDTRLGVRLLRNSTTLITTELLGGYNASTGGSNAIGSSSAEYLDSPATTSSVTYKTQIASTNNIATALVQWNGAVSTMVLMEIAG
jgi:hypothetical protein